jgi:hypothetical protein
MRVLVGLAVCALGCDGATEVVVAASADAVVVVQDGDGPWTQVPVVDGEVRFTSTAGLFGVAQLCPPGPRTRVAPSVRFETDPEELHDLVCGWPDQEYVTLSGTAPTGTHVFGRTSEWTEVDETGRFTFTLPRGVNDVIAYRPGAPARFLRRSIDLQTDTELAFPVDTDGLVMPVQTPTIVGAPDDGLTLYSDINTEDSVVYAYFEGTPPTVVVPPLAGLAATDRATIGARAHGCTAQLPVTAEDPTLVIPRELYGGVSRRFAQWNADPGIEWEGVSVLLAFETGIYASRSYLEASGTTEAIPIVDVTALPGWRAELGGPTVGDDLDWELGIYRGDYDGDYNGCWISGTLTW